MALSMRFWEPVVLRGEFFNRIDERLLHRTERLITRAQGALQEELRRFLGLGAAGIGFVAQRKSVPRDLLFLRGSYRDKVRGQLPFRLPVSGTKLMPLRLQPTSTHAPRAYPNQINTETEDPPDADATRSHD